MELLNGVTALLVGLLSCGSVTGIVAYVLHRAAEKRIKTAEARVREAEARLAEANVEKARWERYEHQLDHAAKTNEKLHSMLERDAEELRDKTDRIRELTDKMLVSEGKLDDANLRIARLTEQRDTERLLKERYKGWHCRSSVCQEGSPDPKGRRPPNPRIIGKRFTLRDITESQSNESQSNEPSSDGPSQNDTDK